MPAALKAARGLRILLYANVERGEAGGVQAVVRSLSDYLAERGHHVSTGWSSTNETEGLNAQDWAEHFPIRAGQRRWLHLPTAVRLAVRLLRERPDVVNIHFASASARYFYTLASLLGYRTILTCHGSDVLRPLVQDAPHLLAVITGADGVTAVSQDIAAHIGAHRTGPSTMPVAVISNGVDTRFWHAALQTAPRSGPAAFRLIAVGRLELVKGFDILIDALARLRAAGFEACLTLIGDGAQRAALGEQARAAGIADRVDFAGRLPREEIRARLHAADLFVLPSRSEGTPLALLEAMATGTACLAASVGGVPASAGTAVQLVAPEDPEALSVAISGLIADPSARSDLASSARARAQAFCIDDTHAAYEALMLNLAGSTLK